MKILILEDSYERIILFKKYFGRKHTLYFYDQVEDAKKALETLGPFEVIFLDHDLDGRIYVDSEELNTGYQLAKYLAEKDTEADIYIHTMNSIGAAKMQEKLPLARRVIFDEISDLLL
jgi:CheY-like chemotaxis protein